MKLNAISADIGSQVSVSMIDRSFLLVNGYKQDHPRMNVATDQTKSSDLFRSKIIDFNRSNNLYDTQWMVIIGHRSSKRTFGANKGLT